MESFTDAFFEVDGNWIVTYWNKEAERLLLKTKAEIVGKNLWNVFSTAIALKFFTEYHNAMEQNVAIRFEEYFPSRNLWMEVAAFPSGYGLSVYLKDITVTKNATAILEQERKKYTDLFNLSPVVQWVYDETTFNFLDVNQAAVDHYGYARSEFLQMTIKDISLLDDVAAFEEMHCNDVVPGLFKKNTLRHQKKDGSIILVCIEGNPVCFEGRAARLVMVVDRTAEVEAERAMLESAKRFEIVAKATSDAIWDWDITTGAMAWNQGIKGVFGHKEHLPSKQWKQDHVHPDDVERVQKELSLLIQSQKTRVQLEYRFRSGDGSYRYVLDRAFIIFNEDGLPVRIIGSMQDITDRVTQLRAIETQNAKLREISWIQCHQVRSPLARILSLVELITESRSDMVVIGEFIPLLKSSAEELDLILKEIVQKTNESSTNLATFRNT